MAEPNSTATPIASPPTDTPPAAATVKGDRGPGVGVLVAGSALTVLVVLVGGRRRAARR
ncbi:hypothetical protein AB0B27_18845 [Micromonospora rifamycinica]|uniref:hypothetical protein n=1 Tax=Micromonospora rifamycinica TaxID=291594 RepID=UPI0033EE5589